MRVLFVSQYGVMAASSRSRVFQYLPHFRRSGVNTRVITVLPDTAIRSSQMGVTQKPFRKLVYYIWASWRTTMCGLEAWWRARYVDILFIQKVIFPCPIRWLLRHSAATIAFDFDDAIFTTEVRKMNWLASWKKRRNERGLPAMLKLAELAVVENPYTAEFASTYCDVFTITGPIDTEQYCSLQHASNNTRVVLGWIGSGTSAQYLDLIREPLRRLSSRYPGLTFRIIGIKNWTEEGVHVENKSWSIENEATDLQGFDVGLMPITDDPWTRGKGGYKLLQYMATGLPVVTSPVGINREIVEDGSSGFWASTPNEWEDCIRRLIDDVGLRRSMGQCGRARVEAKYALVIHQERLLTRLRELLDQRPGNRSSVA